MKIIIAGASPIGIHLAELLSREEQDIIVMDSDADKLSELDDNFDLLTLNISPSSIKGLKEAGVADADLFIATSTEEHYNITCCTMAHKLGAKKTIARVDNYEYMQDEYKEMFTELGISSLIYPEQLAGQEIINSIKTSWIRQWWEVEDGALVLIGVKVRQNASIIDTSLKELGIQKMPFHVVAIKRNGSMIIPHGDDMIRHLDIVYFMASKQDLPRIKQMVGKEDYRDVKNIAIMGGGKVAYHTVLQAPGYMRFKIVEIDEKRINELHQKLNISNDRLMIFRGDGRDISKFKEEYQNIEAFVALTGNSEHNILACLTAKSFGVRKTGRLRRRTRELLRRSSRRNIRPRNPTRKSARPGCRRSGWTDGSRTHGTSAKNMRWRIPCTARAGHPPNSGHFPTRINSISASR